MAAEAVLPPAGHAAAAPRERLRALDIARGAVMVLMAIDHVRVYAGVPPGGPQPGVFLTRWVTHFCAPVFVFLAGTSAYLHGERLGGRGTLARWLALRGAWIVLLELTVVRVAWTFNFAFERYALAGVLWMIGWSMIALALLVRLPTAVIGGFGLALVAGHNLTAWLSRETVGRLLAGELGGLWRILYFGGGIRVGGSATPNFLVLYSFVPWIGVMAAGYAFGALMRREPERCRRACLAIGGAATAAFCVLRGLDLYGDRPWSASTELPAWMAFLATTKYPASLLFLLMTLGPTILVLPLLERWRGHIAEWLTVYGRVPFFYYLLHIPAIHLVALAIARLRSPEATPWLFGDHPMNPGPVPAGYEWSLGLLYAVTALVVVALYFPCRWFAALKRRRREVWLSYL